MFERETEIKDTVEFEVQLAQRLLQNEKWEYPYREYRITQGAKSRATPQGILYIGVNQEWNNITELRETITALLIDLQTGFQKRENFIWQRSAKKLGLIKDITADDKCECKYCGKLSVLTHYQMCGHCYKVYQTLRENRALIDRMLMEEVCNPSSELYLYHSEDSSSS